MEAEYTDSGHGRSGEMHDKDGMPSRERRKGEFDDLPEIESDKVQVSSTHVSKPKRKRSEQRDDKEHRSRDQEKSKAFDALKDRENEIKDSGKDRPSSRDRKKEDRDEREKDKSRGKEREKDTDREKQREKETDKEKEHKNKEREKERDHRRDKELGRAGERVRDKERDKEKNRGKDKDREKERDRRNDREQEKDKERVREYGRDRSKDTTEREKGKDRNRESEKQVDQETDRARERHVSSLIQADRTMDDLSLLGESSRDGQSSMEQGGNSKHNNDSKIVNRDEKAVASTLEIEGRISKMKEERLAKLSGGASEVLAWVNKSRKLEEKKSEKDKAFQLSKVFEEQDNMNDGDSDDEAQHMSQLGGVKILHGLEKVLEGGAVVLTLKDQSILADGDINQEVDILENVEIGEQKRRDEAYKATKKKAGVYDDKFNNEPVAGKRMLPQYDDPVADEGVTLDSTGRFTGEAERKVEELRKRIQGVSSSVKGEDLNSTWRVSTDYYTEEEMIKFKRTKKKKSLRKKDKLDLDALEAEAVSTGLGAGDLGSRNNRTTQNNKEEQERTEAEMRSNAYQSAYAKAEEVSKALRLEQDNRMPTKDEDILDDDDLELQKSLELARRVALKRQDEGENAAPHVMTLLAVSSHNANVNNLNSDSGGQQENKVVFTEMDEFVWGLQLDEEEKRPDVEDVFMEEDETPITSDHAAQDKDSGWTDVIETMEEDAPAKDKEEVVLDEIIHESAVGKGLAGALKLLKERGALKETIEWGGRNMDKKKSKLVGIHDNNEAKEIRIERTDEYGRILTPKESFRLLSHKFHGKGPGKMKQEKRMRQYQEELKVKQMKNADTPSLSVARMRDAQVKLQTPYLVLSGNVRPGQSSDPRSGFATVEKDLAGGLTPMLGDKKVEHFLNIKRKSEFGGSSASEKP